FAFVVGGTTASLCPRRLGQGIGLYRLADPPGAGFGSWNRGNRLGTSFLWKRRERTPGICVGPVSSKLSRCSTVAAMAADSSSSGRKRRLRVLYRLCPQRYSAHILRPGGRSPLGCGAMVSGSHRGGGSGSL